MLNNSKEKSLALEKTEALLLQTIQGKEIIVPQGGFDNLSNCEGMIQQMLNVRRVSGIVIAMLIARIRDAKLYPSELTWPQYRMKGKERLGIGRQEIWRYEQIADAFVMYYTQLSEIGFMGQGDTTKLMFLNEAVVKHGKKAAFKNFAEMSTAEYETWVKGRAARIPYRGKDFGVSKTALLYEGHEVIAFSDIKDIAAAGKIDELKAAVQKIRQESKKKK